MAYFAAIKVTDVNGNIVELIDTTELLVEILKELTAIRLTLAELAEVEITKEDIEDGT